MHIVKVFFCMHMKEEDRAEGAITGIKTPAFQVLTPADEKQCF